jgi:putative membrane protein
MMYGGGSSIHGGGHVVRGFGHGFMAYGQSGWMGWLPLALHVLFFVAIIMFGVILLRRHAKNVRAYRKLNDPALLILRERYALGEIETEEFVRRKNDLTI